MPATHGVPTRQVVFGPVLLAALAVLAACNAGDDKARSVPVAPVATGGSGGEQDTAPAMPDTGLPDSSIPAGGTGPTGTFPTGPTGPSDTSRTGTHTGDPCAGVSPADTAQCENPLCVLCTDDCVDYATQLASLHPRCGPFEDVGGYTCTTADGTVYEVLYDVTMFGGPFWYFDPATGALVATVELTDGYVCPEYPYGRWYGGPIECAVSNSWKLPCDSGGSGGSGSSAGGSGSTGGGAGGSGP